MCVRSSRSLAHTRPEATLPAPLSIDRADQPCWQLPRRRVIHPTDSAPLPARLEV